MSSAKLKKLVTEIVIYSVVVIFSSVGLIQTTKYKPKTSSQYFVNGNLKYAMLSVPVPIDLRMEGQSIDYKVTCSMHKGLLECKEAS
jgi:hypothetical protein